VEVEWHAPVGADRQTPHDRDEVYVVVRGSADFAVWRELLRSLIAPRSS